MAYTKSEIRSAMASHHPLATALPVVRVTSRVQNAAFVVPTAAPTGVRCSCGTEWYDVGHLIAALEYARGNHPDVDEIPELGDCEFSPDDAGYCLVHRCYMGEELPAHAELRRRVERDLAQKAQARGETI